MAYPGAKMAEGGAKPPGLGGVKPPEVWHVPERERPLWKHQASLPRLPVPTVEASVVMYLNSVKPLCTPEQWERTRKACMDFLTSPLSSELQARLRKRAAEKSDSSWLIDWWNELSYFGFRDPVTIWVSYFFLFTRDSWSKMHQTKRAAGFVKAGLRYRDLITSGSLPPEVAGRRPQDMTMYRYLFNATRRPHPGKDYYATYDCAYYHHIVVMCRGRMFKVETRGEDGQELSMDQLQEELEAVKRMSATGEAGRVGVLTSDNRDKWAAGRTLLEKTHAKQLAAIDSAVLVVCLDDCALDTTEGNARNAWHGDGHNRWFDKPMQFIVASNGEAGLCGEHGIMDGTPTVACADWILNSLAKGAIAPGAGSRGPVPPTELKFQLNAESTERVAAAEQSFRTLINSQELQVLDWRRFGKKGIKELKVSPDAFVQMAIQLAYKRLHGKFGATYEACSTRSFLHGRTETIRSCHVPGATFCNAMDNPTMSSKQRYKLLNAAAKHQSWYAQRAVAAQGCDRHLMGLKLLCKKGENPEIFQDPMYAYSSSWVLSTSALGSEHFACWGYGEVVPNGYGLSYTMNPNNVSFVITTLVDHPIPAGRMKEELNRALADMHAMCKDALAASL